MEFWKTNKLGLFALLIIILIGIITRFAFIHYLIDFNLDQGRHAIYYMSIRDGVLPSLGPEAAYYGFHLLPLTLYFPLPFAAFLSNPVYFVIPFALMSFSSTFLLMKLIYDIFDNSTGKKRLTLSLLGGLLWSLFTYDILTASSFWNPHVVPFFLFLYFIIFNKLRTNSYSIKKLVLAIIALGFITAVLISAQGLLMITIPVITTILLSKVCIEQKDKKLAAILFVTLFLSIIFFFAPYIYAETHRDWSNTLLIINSILDKASTLGGASDNKLARLIEILLFEWKRGLLQGFVSNYAWIPATFFSVIGIVMFRGNKKLFNMLMIFFVTYLAAFTVHSDKQHYHYFYPLFIYPIIFILSTINYFWTNSAKVFNKIALTFSLVFFLLLIAINAFGSFNFINRKLHMLNTYDRTEALKFIPDGARVCYEGLSHIKIDQTPPLEYLDKYLLNKSHDFEEECSPGSYFIYPKYQLVADKQFQYTSNRYDPQENLKLIYESERYNLFLVE